MTERQLHLIHGYCQSCLSQACHGCERAPEGTLLRASSDFREALVNLWRQVEKATWDVIEKLLRRN